MKIAVICNNYGETHDGIGAYTSLLVKHFPEKFETTIFTASCHAQNKKIKKFFSLGMSKQFQQVIHALKNESFQVVLIEYPFVEWNPIVVFMMFLLKKTAKKRNAIVVSSFHEYDRVNFFRKKAIEAMAKFSDKILVSNTKTGELLSEFCSTYQVREIPSNIDMQWNECSLQKNEYVFFGLVNGAKAFKEMLSGWDAFNIDEAKILHIISGTKLENIVESHRNVSYYYRASDEEIATIMSSCSFCIVPVKPTVDAKNATFKTGCMMKCISIGCFCDEYKNLPFVYNMEQYTADCFLEAFRRTNLFTNKEISKLGAKAEKFALQYSIDRVATVVVNYLDSM